MLRTATALPPFPAAGAAPLEEAPTSESDQRVMGQMETGDTADRATENHQIVGGRYAMSLGCSEAPLTQPSTASATVRVTASMSTGTEGGVTAIRRRRGQPQGSGRGSRPKSTGRRAATSGGRIPRAGGSEPPPAPDQRRGNHGETQPSREGK